MAKIAQIPLGTAPYGTGRYAAMLNLTLWRSQSVLGWRLNEFVTIWMM